MTKQYLLMVDDEGMQRIRGVCGGIEYLEVQGMDVGGVNTYKILVAPVIPPVPSVQVEAVESKNDVVHD